MKTLIYLATPYSHPNEEVRESRFRAVNIYAAILMRRGLHIFSPISHTHPIAMAGGLPTDWKFWRDYDYAILSMCCKLIVMKLPGWEESKGIKGEIEIAIDLGIPIEYH